MKKMNALFLGVLGVVGMAFTSAASARVFVNIGGGSGYYAPARVYSPAPVVVVSEPRYRHWRYYDRPGNYYPTRYYHYHRRYYR